MKKKRDDTKKERMKYRMEGGGEEEILSIKLTKHLITATSRVCSGVSELYIANWEIKTDKRVTRVSTGAQSTRRTGIIFSGLISVKNLHLGTIYS